METLWTPKELMRCHVRALFTQDEDGRLIAVNRSAGAQAPRFFLGRTAEGNLWWMCKDVSAQLAEELAVGDRGKHARASVSMASCLFKAPFAVKVTSVPE